MVGRKLTNHEGETHQNISTRPDNILGCSNLWGMGGYLPGSLYWGTMDNEGEKLPHKPFGNDSSRPGCEDIHKAAPTSEKCSPNAGQQNSISIPGEDGRHQNKALTEISKSLWAYLLSKKITLTAEYLPSKLNIEADYQSRNVVDWSEWKLCTQSFKTICATMGKPDMDLFASRTSHQLKAYMSLKPDPLCRAVDALQQSWMHLFPYAFPPFNLIGKVLKKTQDQQVTMIIVTPVWVTQPWYPVLLGMSIHQPILLPMHQGILKDPRGNTHPLVLNNSLQLSTWLVSGQEWRVKKFQQELLNLSPNPDLWEQDIIMTQPGRNLVAGAVKGKSILFSVT